MRLLLCHGSRQQVIPQDQFLTLLVAGNGFSPDLIYFCGGQIVMHQLRPALKTAIYGPVTAVSGGVPQEVGAVGGTEKHTTAGILHRSSAISRPVSVLGLAQKLLGGLALRAGKSGHLAQLYDPDAPQIFAGFLAVKAGDTVVEPVPPQTGEQQAFADALLAAQNADLVKLAPRTETTRHGSHQHFAGDGAGVAVILGAQIVNEQGIQPLFAVPLQPGQIAAHRILGVAAAGQGYRVRCLGGTAEVVDRLQIPAHTRVILVSPVPFTVTPRPRERASAPQTIRKGILPDPALQHRVVLKDHPRVLRGAGQRTLLGADQLPLPVLGIVRGFLRLLLEVILYRGEPRQRVFNGLVPQPRCSRAVTLSQGAHLLPAGQGGCRGAGGYVCIEIPEAVNPNQIPRVQQLASGGVCAVVAVDKVIVIVQHRACGGAAQRIGQASGAGIHIDARQKLLDRCRNIVFPAESAHCTAFGGGIGLLAAGQRDRLRGAGRPLPHVMPVQIGVQQLRHGDALTVRGVLAHPLAVCAAAGPVHQALVFKGGAVKDHHFRVQHLRQHPGAGLVLFRLHHTICGKDCPQPGVLRVVLPGGVDRRRAHSLNGCHPLLCAAGGAVVHIQRDQAAPGAAAAAAQTVPQAAAHKAAHVLALVLLSLGQCHVFRVGLGATVAIHPG